MILVTTGTHVQPFDRLVRAAEQVALAVDEEVVVQRGASKEPAPHCRVVDLLPWSELEALMGQARVVVCHTGPATVFQAASHGHVPVVVPRSASHGEHVDDHQRWFASWLRDKVDLVEDPAELVEAVTRHEDRVRGLAPLRSSPEEIAATADQMASLVRQVARRSPRSYNAMNALVSLFQRKRRSDR